MLLGALFMAYRSGYLTANKEGKPGSLRLALAFWLYSFVVFGGFPEGMMYAILLMNAATPLIDLYTQPRVFGRELDSK